MLHGVRPGQHSRYLNGQVRMRYQRQSRSIVLPPDSVGDAAPSGNGNIRFEPRLANCFTTLGVESKTTIA